MITSMLYYLKQLIFIIVGSKIQSIFHHWSMRKTAIHSVAISKIPVSIFIDRSIAI